MTREYSVKPLFLFGGQSDTEVLEPERLPPAELKRSLKLIDRISTEFPNANFYVYYIPDITELDSGAIYDFNIARFEQTCAELNMNCVTPDFRAGLDVDTLYIPEDHHFSELGARTVADQIGTLLTRN